MAKAQNIGINATGATPNTSAGLDIDFTNKGLLIPRIALTSTTDITTIASPATSSLVYNTNAGITSGSGTGYYYFDGAKWVRLFDSNLPIKAWELLGNAGTNPATNFLGTTDAQDLVFKTANVEKMRIGTNGFVGIGTPTPSDELNIVPQNAGGIRLGSANFNATSLKMGISAGSNGYSYLESIKLSGLSYGDLALNPVAGNVGIGTSTPSARLNIDPQGAGGILIGNSNAGAGGFTSLRMGISANTGGYATIETIRSAGSAFGDLAINPNGGNVGIGTTNIQFGAKLNILDNSANPVWTYMEGENLDRGIILRTASTVSNGHIPIIGLFRGDGTLASPLPVRSDQWLGAIAPGGYDGGSWTQAGTGSTGGGGGILFYSAGNWSPTSHPFRMVLKTVPSGSVFGLERIVIEDNGNVGIGAIVPAYKLQVAGNIGATGFINTSDQRLKNNILPSKYGLKEVMQLKPVTFQWNKDNDGTRVGFIAQEVRRIVPEIVSEAKDENKTLGIYYNEFAPIFTKAIQEQQTIIEKQQKQISDLEKRLEKQEKLLEELLKRK